MPTYERKFGIRFYRLQGHWALGLMYDEEQLAIGLIKWQLVIGLFIHYDKIPF